MEYFPVSSITVKERQRKSISDAAVAELADSIRRLGLINPITITRDGDLVAGERRLRAVQRLGWDRVPVIFRDQLTPLMAHLIELEENIKRVDLTWQEQVDAVRKYHEVRLTEDETWTAEKTGEAIGLSPSTVSKYLTVADQLQAKPELAKSAGVSSVYNKVRRAVSRQIAAELDIFGEAEKGPSRHVLQLANFLATLQNWPHGRFNLIHCDFPYGINMDTAALQSSDQTWERYEDSKDTYFTLLRAFCENIDTVAQPSCHIIFWFSMTYYTETLAALRGAGLDVNPFPLVWLRANNSGLLPDPRRGPRRVYETAFLASRGDRHVVDPVANAVAIPASKSTALHLSEKPIPVLQHFFRMLVDETTEILDPTCGAASALAAALSGGAKRAVGLDISQGSIDAATLRMKEFSK